MIIALLPRGTGVGELAGRGLAVGLLSAGMGEVPAEQTYLDITQGNRVFGSLYDSDLQPLRIARNRVRGWRAVVERADSAPAEIVPGLLASTLKRAGVAVEATPSSGSTATAASESAAPALLVADRTGRLGRAGALATLVVISATPPKLASLAKRLRGDDLLIALEKPPPAANRALAIGIAGRGFEGNLSSVSTRTDGYVLSTDLAPTVLSRFGLAVPPGMSGEPIRAEGGIDAAAVASLGDRLAAIPERRGPVIGLGLLVWLGALGLAAAATRGRAARPGVRLIGLSVVYLPLLLLLGAALQPSRGVEQLLAIAGPPLLALLTLATLDGYRALAVASGLAVLAYALDVVAGSPLTSLSLVGPNPGLGVRFYGIGNELEASLAVLVVAGTGAALSGFAPRLPAARSAAAFLAAGLLLAFVFAAGRFGADVGAAIVLPLGGAVAAAAIAARRRRAALLALAAPAAALALLALVDLASGANAHLTRTVLDAGGLEDLADAAQRRLQLSARSFTRPIVLAFMPLVLAAAAWVTLARQRIAAWLRGRAAMRAGLLGALAATLVGALANDSGALLLEIGAIYLLVFVGFAWADAQPPPARSGGPDKKLHFRSPRVTGIPVGWRAWRQ